MAPVTVMAKMGLLGIQLEREAEATRVFPVILELKYDSMIYE